MNLKPHFSRFREANPERLHFAAHSHHLWPDVTFEARAINALRVNIVDASGWLARNGFKDGDLIVAINGKEFTDEKGMSRAWAGAMANETVEFTVQRGGGSVKITANSEEFMDGVNHGGHMEPVAR